MPTARTRGSVVVLYNSVSDEGYDALKHVDPASLGFTPTYDIAVATVAEEYEAIIAALRKEGFQARGVNLQDKIATLEELEREFDVQELEFFAKNESGFGSRPPLATTSPA